MEQLFQSTKRGRMWSCFFIFFASLNAILLWYAWYNFVEDVWLSINNSIYTEFEILFYLTR